MPTCCRSVYEKSAESAVIRRGAAVIVSLQVLVHPQLIAVVHHTAVRVMIVQWGVGS
jgi:hypothetical protein